MSPRPADGQLTTSLSSNTRAGSGANRHRVGGDEPGRRHAVLRQAFAKTEATLRSANPGWFPDANRSRKAQRLDMPATEGAECVGSRLLERKGRSGPRRGALSRHCRTGAGLACLRGRFRLLGKRTANTRHRASHPIGVPESAWRSAIAPSTRNTAAAIACTSLAGRRAANLLPR